VGFFFHIKIVIASRLPESYTCTMVYHGHIKDGRVVLDEPANLPEGAAVSVEVVVAPVIKPEDGRPTTLGQRLMKLSGILEGMPEDGSRNHDHYIYGKPK